MLPPVVVVVPVIKGIVLPLLFVRELETVKFWPVKTREYGSLVGPLSLILALTPVVPVSALIADSSPLRELFEAVTSIVLLLIVIVPVPNSLSVWEAYSPVVDVGVPVLKGIAVLPSVRELETVKVVEAS